MDLSPDTLSRFLIMALVFVFGVALGSFGNVLVYRLRSGVSIMGRSRCLSCGKALTPRMLIPIFSYLLQRGRCAHCRSKIALQYPLVEFVAGLLAVMVFWRIGLDLAVFSIPPSPFQGEGWGEGMFFPLSLFLIDLLFFETLLLVTVYDLRHKIIPDGMVLVLVVLGILRALLALGIAPSPFQGEGWGEGMWLFPAFDLYPIVAAWWNPWLNLGAGPLLGLPFALLWLVSGGRWMGLGDAKLAAPLGFAFGLGYGLTGIILGFWIGAVVCVVLLLFTHLFSRGKGITMKSELPFAPFLACGALVAYMCAINIANWTF